MSEMVPAAEPGGDDPIELAAPLPAEAAEETEPSTSDEGEGSGKGSPATVGGSSPPASSPYSGPPAVPDHGGGDDNGFLSLGMRVMAVVSQAARLTASMHLLKRRADSNATKARVAAEFCDQADVEEEFTTMIMEASAAHSRVADASGELSEAADSMEFKGRSFKDAHQREYRGIYERVKASGRRQPKPGFNKVK